MIKILLYKLIRCILIVFIGCTILFTKCSFFKFDSIKYVNEEIGIDISNCNIEKEIDTHGGINGDGDYLIVADCSKDNNSVKKQVTNWRSLPLSKNLQTIMYGGTISGRDYRYNLAKDHNIPKIKNGYYYFIDRYAIQYRDINNINSDENLFNRYSFNFTLAMFDEDNKKIYYYEFDT